MPNYDTSTQANRVYLTEKADDWVLVYEHKEEFDGEPNGWSREESEKSLKIYWLSSIV